MLNVAIIGASGYTGAELAHYLTKHPQLELAGLFVSAQSLDAGKALSQLYGQLRGVVDLPLQALSIENIATQFAHIDAVFLATAHEVSHDLAPLFLQAGCRVFDLSGAYRVNHAPFYQTHYGFEHKHAALLDRAVYGLAEWNGDALVNADLVAVAGCYPTASLIALKPLAEAGLIAKGTKPIINAVSGVSGAGRKASLTSHFCQVSLNPYGVFNHRHQPEIATHLGREVIFTPHLGNFKRGILATIHVQLSANTNTEAVKLAFEQAYGTQPIVRLREHGWPSVDDVVNTPYIDVAWAQQGDDLIVVSAEDNLLKGAASQAIQCFNLSFGFAPTTALL